jgi:hypothetical protein
MPRVKLTKTVIDALPNPSKDIVHWDTGCPGFGVKVTPKGRKIFIVLYRTAGAGSRLRKYTIGPYGRVTLNQARVTAQKVFAAKLDGRDLAAEKKDSRRRMVADRVDDLLEAFIAQHISQNRSAPEISRMLRREVGSAWGTRSIHEITKRDVIDVVSAIEQRGAPVAANKALKSIKTFFRWCVGRAVLDRSPADGAPLPAKQVTRDRVLNDGELAQVILAARQIGGPSLRLADHCAKSGPSSWCQIERQISELGQSETSKSEWSTSVCPPAADPDQGKGFVGFVPQRDENRGKSAIPKRTFRGPGTEIAASRTK